jgi:hypothetical protein
MDLQNEAQTPLTQSLQKAEDERKSDQVAHARSFSAFTTVGQE